MIKFLLPTVCLLAGAFCSAAATDFNKHPLPVSELTSGANVTTRQYKAQELKTLTPQAAPAKEEGAIGTISVTSTHASYEYMADLVFVYNEAGMYQNMDLMMGSSTANISVPEGTYDLLLGYTARDLMTKHVYVIKEGLNVVAGETLDLTLTPDDATVHLGVVSYNPEGEEWDVDIVSYNEETDEEYISHEGNSVILFNNLIVREGVGLIGGGILRADFFYEEEGPINEGLDFYVSPTSDKYYFLQERIQVSKSTGEQYINRFGFTGSQESKTLSNDPANYAWFHEALTVPHTNTDEYRAGMNSWTVVFGNMLNGWTSNMGSQLVDADGGAGYWYDKAGCTGGVNQFITLAVPFFTNIETRGEEDDLSYYSFPVYSQQVYNSGEEATYIENANDLFYKDNYAMGGAEWLFAYPGAEAFNYTPEEAKVGYLETSPFAVFKLKQLIQAKRNRFNVGLDFRSIRGGILDCYLPNVELSVKYNGDEVWTDAENFAQQFGTKWFNGKHDDGVFDISIVNEATCGENVCKNVTEVHFDQAQEDWTPPTLRMLQYRTPDGMVDDHLKLDELGELRFAVCDLNYDPTAKLYNCLLPTTITVEYSAAGLDEWKELNVPASPEVSYDNYGSVYCINLNDELEDADKGVYDVRIQLADAAGNTYSQVLRNSFTLEPPTGVDGIQNVDEVKAVRYYDLLGRPLQSSADRIGIKAIELQNGQRVVVKHIGK